MPAEIVILIAEDDEGHARLIKKNLGRAGIANRLVHFLDGQDVLDFLFRTGDGPHRESGTGYLLLLDIRMPRVDGVQVLAKIKGHEELKKIPVIMLTTSDNPREIEACHKLGCSNYVPKPVEYERFATAIRQLGFFLSVVKVPAINGDSQKEISIQAPD